MTFATAVRGALALVAGLAAVAFAAPVGAQTTFAANSLIIPMDTASQDSGMLRAYGLVYELTRRGVPVNWAISPTKPPNGDDFSITAAPPNPALQDVRSGTTSGNRSFRGGPFVVDASFAAAALPIIQAWQATSGDNTAVLRMLVAAPSVPVARTITRAPRISVLLEGNEAIAFNNLNAAGIPDSVGSAWSAASPDLLTETAVTGASFTNHGDGALFHVASGLPRYCFFTAMHYDALTLPIALEVAQETRQWLDRGPLTSLYAQCNAATQFENFPAGKFLTNAGMADDGNAPSQVTQRAPAVPGAQYDGAFQVDSGAVDSFQGVQPPGSIPIYKNGVTTYINESTSQLGQRIVLLSGRLDGAFENGRVSYLAGHDYTLTLPVSANPQTNGVRLFLDAIFASDCAIDAGQSLPLVQSGATVTAGSSLTYTLTASNPGPRPAENLRLVARVPAGATFSSATNGGTHAAGLVTWNLAPLALGGIVTVTYTATVPAVPGSDGDYTSTASIQVATLDVRQYDANAVTTTRDTAPPVVTITGGPSVTNDSTPTFTFTRGADAVIVECRIDSDAFAGCSGGSFTAAPLAEAAHVFEVRVADAAGNTNSAAQNFTVDLTAPTVTIPGVPTNTPRTNDTTPTFVFSIDGGPASTQCTVGAITGPCTSPYTFASPLADGLYILDVVPTDTAGNVGPAGQWQFAVDTVEPRVTSFDSVAKGDWTTLGPARLRTAVTQVLVGFDEAMREASVEASANWKLVAAGGNGTIDTTACAAIGGDDVAFAISGIEYRQAPDLAAVAVGNGAGLQAGTYRLFACAGVLDYAGNGLDGASNGGGAEDFKLDFVSLLNPRVQNPNFDAGLAGWTLTAPGSDPWLLDNVDAEGQPFSGNARASGEDDGAGQQWRMEQCVAVADLEPVTLTALVRFSSLTPGAPTLRQSISWFGAAACAGTAIATDNSPLLTPVDFNWRLVAIAPATPPPGAQSLRIGFEVNSGAADTFNVDIDRVLYPDPLIMFRDGFE